MKSAKGITIIFAIIAAFFVLLYMANYSLSSHIVPSLQEFIASSTPSVATTTPDISTNSTTTELTVPITATYSDFRAPHTTFRVTTAKTPAARELGLGGRDSIAPDEGLLFIFPTSEVVGFWMKDMKFPIDIIWIDSSRKVVTIEENVSPETYPKSFYPTRKAQFVLEVNAGNAKKSGLQEGTTVLF